MFNPPSIDQDIVLEDLVNGGVMTLEDYVKRGGFYELDAVTRDIRDKLAELTSIKDFGAAGDGVTSDATPFQSLWEAARTTSGLGVASGSYSMGAVGAGGLLLPPGRYVYDGPGLDITANRQPIILRAMIPGTVQVIITSDSYLFDVAGDFLLGRVHIEGINFFGGKGVLKVHKTAPNTPAAPKTIHDCLFLGFTEAAIASLSSDVGMWSILRNRFHADETKPRTVCVALNGFNDNSEIKCNFFSCGNYLIRLGAGGNRCVVENNGFFRAVDFDPAALMNCIHLVPHTTSTNAGTGLRIKHNKFGTEKLSSNDLRILIADLDTGGAGSDFATYGHLAATSAGFVNGVVTEDNDIGSQGTGTQPWITSYCPNLYGFRIDDLFAGAHPKLISFLGDRASNQLTQSSIGRLRKQGVENGFVDIGDGPILWEDPLALGNLGEVVMPYGQTNLGYKPCAVPAIGGWTVDSNASSTTITDGDGLANAGLEITYTTAAGFKQQSGGAWSLADAGIGIDEVCWLELQVQRALTEALTRLDVRLMRVTGGTMVFRRVITLPTSGWGLLRAPFRPQDVTSDLFFRLLPGDYLVGMKSKVQVGRARVYANPTPLDLPRLVRYANGVTWIDSTGALRISATDPSDYDADGALV